MGDQVSEVSGEIAYFINQAIFLPISRNGQFHALLSNISICISVLT